MEIIEKLKALNYDINEVESQINKNEEVRNTEQFILQLKLLDAMKLYRDTLSEICIYQGYNPITGIRINKYESNTDNNSNICQTVGK